MRLRHPRSVSPRRGVVVVFVAILLIPLLAMVAFAVDIGYLKVVQGELQNAADAACLAGGSQLMDRDQLKGWYSLDSKDPAILALQQPDIDNARAEAVKFALKNSAGNVFLTVDPNTSNDPNGDIVVGFIANPKDQSAPMVYTTYPYNSIRVRVRRTNTQNGALTLFFARYLGYKTAGLEATATATYEGGIKGFTVKNTGPKNSKLLPFALDITVWNELMAGRGDDQWEYDPVTNEYVRGKDGIPEQNLYPWGLTPGNFATLDIGDYNNSSSDISRQILEGPNQTDFERMGGAFDLGPDGKRITQGDTGVSAGFKDELRKIRGEKRIIPLYQPPIVNPGNNAEFTIVGFAGIIITEVQLTGSLQHVKHVTIQPEFVDDGTAIGGGNYLSSPYITKPLSLSR